jgi:3-methyladenine DNA glycosylase AlkD
MNHQAEGLTLDLRRISEELHHAAERLNALSELVADPHLVANVHSTGDSVAIAQRITQRLIHETRQWEVIPA